MIRIKQLFGAILVIAFTFIASSATASPAFDAMKVKVPEQSLPAPEFSLSTLDQQPIKLSDYKGKVVVLNFWATYCIPCRIEMPSLEKLSQKYKGNDVSVVAISLDEGKEKAIKMLVNKMNLSFPIALEGQASGDDYKVSVLPVTYIIGKDGLLLGRVVGDRDWAGEEADELMKAVLAD
jgi:thiol-disulfide isomerase/thioredoxin